MAGWQAPTTSIDRSAADAACFQDFNLDPRILRALYDDLHFEKCTPIQARSLTPALAGHDVAGRAQTGTGKTAAFLIAILERFLADNGARAPNQPFALALAPTRELGIQIDRDAEALGKYCGLRHVAVYGGTGYDSQRIDIGKGVDLLTATPGRLIDYMRQGIVDLSRVGILIIDEADRMLDMGFIPDVRRIVARLPAASHRQTMLYSATLSPDILRLARTWMRDPVTVEVTPEQVVAAGVEEVVYAVAAREKLALLLWLLRNEACNRVLIFRNRRNDTEDLFDHLTRYDVQCAMMSGDVPQTKRTRILDDFRAGQLRVIVATDVAGRGIHVDGITHVINYDLPYEAEDYVHRIGRTGRAGEQGRAISFACEQRSFVIPDIETFIGRPLPIRHPEPDMLVLPAPIHKRPERAPRVSAPAHGAPARHPRGRRSGPPRSGGR